MNKFSENLICFKSKKSQKNLRYFISDSLPSNELRKLFKAIRACYPFSLKFETYFVS
jgi:hypothetical protein